MRARAQRCCNPRWNTLPLRLEALAVALSGGDCRECICCGVTASFFAGKDNNNKPRQRRQQMGMGGRDQNVHLERMTMADVPAWDGAPRGAREVATTTRGEEDGRPYPWQRRGRRCHAGWMIPRWTSSNGMSQRQQRAFDAIKVSPAQFLYCLQRGWD